MKTHITSQTAAILIYAVLVIAFPRTSLSQPPCITDHFEAGVADEWTPLTPGRWQVSSDAGSLRYFLNTTDYDSPDGIRMGETSLASSGPWGDFTFECLAKSADAAIGSDAADLCIAFAYQDSDSYYYVNFNSAPGLTQLHRVHDGNLVTLATYNQATFISDGNYHTLRVERTGNQIRAFFDGGQLFAVNDSFFGPGQLGVGSYNDSGYFDDVQIAGDACPSTDSFTDIGAALPGITDSAVEWGDYDHDNDLDILLVGSGLAKIYRNDNGNFIDLAADLIGVSFAAAAWGDYDNDGDLDILLTGSSSSGNIAKIYRNNGGSFVDINAALTGVSTSAVAWGDYDNDGDLDILLSGLVFLNNNDAIGIAKIYRNDSGTFLELKAPALPQVAGGSVAWGDYDNDGDLDILLTGLTGSGTFPQTAKILRNDAGNFVAINTSLQGVSQSSVAWGDYDNDGDLDILLTGSFTDEITIPISHVYRNDAGDFVDINAGLTGVNKSSAAWGDYDNDGDLDILLAGARAIPNNPVTKVYRNDSGSFVDIAANLSGVSNGETAWGDYDNDGDLDFLLTGSGIAKIYRNNIGTPNTTPTTPTSLSSSVTGNAVTFNWAKSTDSQTAQNALTYNLRVGRTPGGGEVMSPMSEVSNGFRRLPQVGNTNHNNSWTINNLPPGTYYWSVQAIDNTFAGSAFATEQSFTIAEPFTQIGSSLAGIESSTFAWGDYDNDGDLDVLVTGVVRFRHIARIYRNDSTSSGRRFVDIGAPLAGMYGGSVAWGDYDNDGDLDGLLAGFNDVIVLSKVYRNDLDGAGRKFVDIFAPIVGGGPAVWGDYDNDGDLDIFIRGKIYRNDFTGSGRSFVEVATLTNAFLASAAWGDFDRDGDLDILAGNKIYRNDNFGFVDIVAPLAGERSAWGDYDNDGDLDVLIAGISNSTIVSKVYRNEGGNFVDIGAPLTGVFGSAVAWGDYDNDGDLDILLAGSGVTASKVYRNDDGNFIDIIAGLEGAENAQAAWGDYDNDGDLDFLLAGFSPSDGNATRIYRNNIGTANTLPVAPANLVSALSGNAVNLSWNKASDNQTAQNGLTYNLRVGTTPGGGEVMSPMSEVSGGFRRLP